MSESANVRSLEAVREFRPALFAFALALFASFFATRAPLLPAGLRFEVRGQGSKITVHEHLGQLIKKGAVRRDKAKARSVTILYDPDRQRFVDGVSNRRMPSLPILGTIAAGRPNHGECVIGCRTLVAKPGGPSLTHNRSARLQIGC